MTLRAWALGCLLLGCTQASVTVPSSLAKDAAGASLLPVGIRRLTNQEFARQAEALLGAPLPAAFLQNLPPDVRQEEGYTRNREQTMSQALAVKLADELPPLVDESLARPSSVFTCGAQDADCVGQFIRTTLQRAYRRPTQEAAVAELTRLYFAAARAGTPKDGASAVLSAVLQSPHFWYVTETGAAAERRQSTVTLDRYEMADQIAFMMRGQGADQALLDAADELYDAEVRQAHARRLLTDVNARQHYRQFVLQWLEVDELSRTAKSSSVFERYEAFKQPMLDETLNFVDEVFVHEGASLAGLLTAGFVSVDPNMAVFYGLNHFGARVESQQRGRIGVLQHASFLAAHAHADTTSPVLRGDFVLRKVLCERVPRPSELDIEIIMPRPSEERTRREQFVLHGADPKCAQCHDKIDGFGLTLERFDAAGRARELELGKPVRTDGAVTYRGKRTAFEDSVQLARWLALQPQAADCFARHAFRFVTGHHEPRAEDAFVALRHELPPEDKNNLLEHLVAYVGTEAFVQRRIP